MIYFWCVFLLQFWIQQTVNGAADSFCEPNETIPYFWKSFFGCFHYASTISKYQLGRKKLRRSLYSKGEKKVCDGENWESLGEVSGVQYWVKPGGLGGVEATQGVYTLGGFVKISCVKSGTLGCGLVERVSVKSAQGAKLISVSFLAIAWA
jgi:hypothetical protein